MVGIHGHCPLVWGPQLSPVGNYSSKETRAIAITDVCCIIFYIFMTYFKDVLYNSMCTEFRRIENSENKHHEGKNSIIALHHSSSELSIVSDWKCAVNKQSLHKWMQKIVIKITIIKHIGLCGNYCYYLFLLNVPCIKLDSANYIFLGKIAPCSVSANRGWERL